MTPRGGNNFHAQAAVPMARVPAAERTLVVAGVALVADCCRRALLARGRPARRRRPASGERARASPRAACCCRPTTRRRRWRGLRALVARYAPRVVVALGDSFHDGGGPGAHCAADRAALRALQRGRDWIWIAGNHDPEPAARTRRRFAAMPAHRRARLPPRAVGATRPTARSPATCIRWRASPSAGARSAGAVLRPTDGGW